MQGQRAEQRPFFLPGLTNGLGLPIHATLVILQASLSQLFIEIGKGIGLKQGRHKVAPGIAHPIFHPAFFVARPRRTEVALKQVVAAKQDEAFLLLPVSAL